MASLSEFYKICLQEALQSERRGEIDAAVALWERVWPLEDSDLHSLALAARLKSPSITNEKLLAAQRRWAARFAAPLPGLEAPSFSRYVGDRPLRVGFSCSFWNTDTIKYQVLPFVRCMDASRFQVIGYSPWDEPEEAKQQRPLSLTIILV